MIDTKKWSNQRIRYLIKSLSVLSVEIYQTLKNISCSYQTFMFIYRWFLSPTIRLSGSDQIKTWDKWMYSEGVLLPNQMTLILNNKVLRQVNVFWRCSLLQREHTDPYQIRTWDKWRCSEGVILPNQKTFATDQISTRDKWTSSESVLFLNQKIIWSWRKKVRTR